MAIIEAIGKIIETANQYGFPIPIVLLVFALYRVLISRINWWSKREKYYEVILTNLGNWRDSLSSRLDWFMEPDSEYREDPQSEPYKALNKKGNEAYDKIREQIHFARIFLTDDAVKHLDELFTEEWHQSNFGAVCTNDYLHNVLKLVTKTYDLILADAKSDLKESHKMESIKKLISAKE